MSSHNFKNSGQKNAGFTLVEAVVGSAVLLIIAITAYQAYVSIFKLAGLDQDKVLALELANEQFEIVRNLPYSNIGVPNGIPSGVIPQNQTLVRGGVTFGVSTVIRNIALSLGAQEASSTASTTPAEKLVAVTISCSTCTNFTPLTLTTEVAPKNIITDTTQGALTINAIDSNGNPVSGASVTVTDSQVTPSTVVSDTTGDDGALNIVGVATGTAAYQITVTKSGYSTDRTYPISATNTTPTQPNATVLAEQVTSASFAIDKLSTVNVSSETQACALVPNTNFTIVGAKTIGAGIPKYAATTTTGGTGTFTLNNMEWDTYIFGLSGNSYDLVGMNVINPVKVSPNSTQSVNLVLTAKSPDSLLVAVEDNSTLLPLSGATVTLSNSSGYSSTQTTGEGYLIQTDWSGGPGQSDYTNATHYFSDNGSIANSSPAGDISLVRSGGNYVPSGVLQSSTFDTGTSSNFDNIIWQPSSQPVGAGTNSVQLQIATSPTDTSTTTWNFTGPDGTNGTYYTASNSTISSFNNGNRYVRYEVFLNTQSATNTPELSSVAFTYGTSCTPPGQVLFQGLSPGAYTLTTSAAGYTGSSLSVTVSSSWSQQTVPLGP
jgi:hypothetical protein